MAFRSCRHFRNSRIGANVELIGTAADIADTMQEWFECEGADGYNVMPANMPTGLHDFIEHVVPELRRRGLFRLAYAGKTLRDHRGLATPADAAAAQAEGVATGY